MANKKKNRSPQNQQPQQGQRPVNQPKGQQAGSQQPGRKKETPEEYRLRQQKLQENEINRIKQGGYVTIQQKTVDTAETKNFISILDQLMLKARMTAGLRGSKHTGYDLDTKFMPRIQKAKDELNLLAAELCQLMGQKYRPPRGYTNPLQDKRSTKTEQVAVQQRQAKAAKPPKEPQTAQTVAAPAKPEQLVVAPAPLPITPPAPAPATPTVSG